MICVHCNTPLRQAVFVYSAFTCGCTSRTLIEQATSLPARARTA